MSSMQTEHMRAFKGRQPKPRDALFPNRPEEWEVKAAARDEDGIDWVPDPPEALRKWLLLFKMQNQSKGIGLFQSLRQSGAKPNGLMQVRPSTGDHAAASRASCGGLSSVRAACSQKDQFTIALTSIYREWFFSPKLLKSICHAYGTGLDDPEGGKESVAWRDFCEDVDAQVRVQACRMRTAPKLVCLDCMLRLAFAGHAAGDVGTRHAGSWTPHHGWRRVPSD